MENVMVPLRAQDSVEASIINELRQQIGIQKYNAWFGNGTRIELADGELRLNAPNFFVANWIESHFHEELRQICTEVGGTGAVSINVDPSISHGVRKKQLDHQARLVKSAGEVASRRPARRTTTRHRLNDFVVGESNKLAYHAASAIANGTGPFMHLFVHGACGVGKTHLLQGVCNLAAKAGLKCKYVTGEQFTNDFVASVRTRNGNAFRNQYRHLDLLAIDDVHFLAAKKATQDEFLHTFNAIHSAGKRIVLASDTHPRLVGEMNEQLTSRFVAGMVVKIDRPDRELRVEILRRRSTAMKIAPTPEVLEHIASCVRGSVRELEGALVKLAAVAALKEQPMSVALANEALADQISRSSGVRTLDDIEAIVGAFFGITPADMHSSRRTKLVSIARMLAAFLARRHTAMSFPEIARHMGKNHSSIILSVQRMEKLLNDEGTLKWSTPMGAKSMGAKELVDTLAEQMR